MALTLAQTANTPGTAPINGGAVQFVPVKVTFDASYPTGGEAVTAGSFGLSSIYAVLPAVDLTGTWIAFYVPAAGTTGGKLFAIVSATGAQVASEADLSTAVFNFVVIGT